MGIPGVAERRPSAALAPSRAESRLSGHKLLVARCVWVATVALCAILSAASLPGRFAALANRHDAGLHGGLGQLGISPEFNAWYNVTLEVTCALAFFAIGALIFWRRSDDRMAIFVSLVLSAFGSGLAGTSYAVVANEPIWRISGGLAQGLGWASLLLFAYLFPDGRFVPRWALPATPIWVFWVLAFFLFADRLTTGRPVVIGITFVVWVGWFASGVLAQAHRYVRVDTQVQRQQTKWIVLGFAGALVGVLAASAGHIVALSTGHISTGSLLYDDVAVAVLDLSALLIPVSVAIAILRHNLYDIDFLINRALVYAVLSGMLALVYVLSVFLMQSLIRVWSGQPTSSATVVVATLGVAAAFQPLRLRVQRGIDRRFYRSRYDAARVLADFGATLHQETDLDRLSEQLASIVVRTMEPAHISLWLRSRDGLRRTSE